LDCPIGSADAERCFSVYANVTKDPQQASMVALTKELKMFVKWNKHLLL